MKQIALFLSLALLAAGTAWAAEEKNHCHNEATWAGWHQLLADNQDDDELHGLYAMRRGLCGMVEAGTIEEERATRIFEDARERLTAKWIEENMRRKPML
ncbi:MAG: hypothetical protein Q4G66_07820 [bacterium]|nr:hypothetical protein [bacterium]